MTMCSRPDGRQYSLKERRKPFRIPAVQASEALADLLCHPSGVDRGGSHSYNAPASGGRLQGGKGMGMGYLGGSGGVAAAAARESDLRSRLMFFFDM